MTYKENSTNPNFTELMCINNLTRKDFSWTKV